MLLPALFCINILAIISIGNTVLATNNKPLYKGNNIPRKKLCKQLKRRVWPCRKHIKRGKAINETLRAVTDEELVIQDNKVECSDNFNNITHRIFGERNKQLHRNLRRKRISVFQKERVFTSTIIAIKVSLFFIGVIGNFLILVVIIATRSLHTAQNAFVFNLAITDLFTLLLYLPLTVYKHFVVRWWPFGEFACRFMLPIADIVPSVSILTLVAISFDRYFAITGNSVCTLDCSSIQSCFSIVRSFFHCSTLNASQSNGSKSIVVKSLTKRKSSCLSISNMSRPKMTIIVLVTIWMVCYMSVAFPVSTFAMTYSDKSCLVRFKSPSTAKFYFTMRCVMFYIVPSFVIFICYNCVNNTLASSMQFLSMSANGKSRLKRLKRQRRVMIMFYAIFLSFVICFLPFNMLIIVYNFASPALLRSHPTVLLYTVTLTSTLAIANSVFNPLILYRLSSAFRRGFQRCLPCLGWFTRRGTRKEEASTLSPQSTNIDNTNNHQLQECTSYGTIKKEYKTKVVWTSI